jgi:uncharacterized protein (DUF1800 family)
MQIFVSILIALMLIGQAKAGVKIKGGQLSTSSGNLKTEEPAKRPDLIFNLNDFDSSHLNLKLSKFDAIRFERRIGIGAPLNRVSQWIGLTRKQAIEKVISELENHSDGFIMPLWVSEMTPVSFMEDGLRRDRHSCGTKTFRNSLEDVWAKEIIETSTPQFERLALFWLDHFSVAFDTYNQTHSFAKHLEIIRENSSGNALEFLKASFYDPGMIVYLNNEQSTAQKPNENLAREFLELFSLGEGAYSENDIKNLAKAISGHGINYVTEQFQIFNSKVIKGNFSAFGERYSNIEEFMNLISEHPSFGEFIARKFYAEYVELRDPSKEDLAYMVSVFRESGFEIKALLKATLSLKKFWNEKNKLTLVKSPIELVFGTIRTLGTAGNSGKNFSWAVHAAEDFGQSLFNPPNIAGWPTGKEWLIGQSLERRLTEFPKYFEKMNFERKTDAQVFQREDKRAKRAKEFSLKYNQELEKFFASGAKEQFLAETVVINWIPEDFSTREYADINVSFYNVSFLGKKWNGISVRFGTDKNAKKKHSWKDLNRLSFNQGSSHPAIMRSYSDGWVSDWDGHRGWSSSFPTGPRERFRKKSKEEQLLMKRLLQSMHIPLENLSSFNALFKNLDAQNWLAERIDEVGLDEIETQNGKQPPVKIFSLLKNPHGSKIKKQRFNCSLMRTEDSLAGTFNKYSEKLKENFNYRVLVSTETSPNTSQLLIPALNLKIENKEVLSLLGHEGYQLK